MVINCVQNGPQTSKKYQAIKQCMITVRSFSILVGGFNSPEKNMKKYARHWGSLSISMVESWKPKNRWNHQPNTQHLLSSKLIGVGRLVSITNWWFSGSMFIYQRVSTFIMSPKNDKSGQNHLPTPALRSTEVPAPGFEGMVVMVAMAMSSSSNRIRNSCRVLAS
jgi:hypothetical protein